MRVYAQRRPLDSFRRFVWRLPGQFLIRLHGVNFDFKPPNDLYIEPVFIPFVSWKKDGNRLFVDIHWWWRENCRTLILMAHPPYFWTGLSDAVELKNIEED